MNYRCEFHQDIENSTKVAISPACYMDNERILGDFEGMGFLEGLLIPHEDRNHRILGSLFDQETRKPLGFCIFSQYNTADQKPAVPGTYEGYLITDTPETSNLFHMMASTLDTQRALRTYSFLKSTLDAYVGMEQNAQLVINQTQK